MFSERITIINEHYKKNDKNEKKMKKNVFNHDSH